MDSSSLEVFKNHVDIALRDTVSGHGGGGLMVGLDDLKRSFPTLMILWTTLPTMFDYLLLWNNSTISYLSLQPWEQCPGLVTCCAVLES